MLFLDFFIKEWLSQVPSTIGGAILKGAKTLFFSLDTFIYKLIIDLYDMFINLCTVRLLSNDTLQLLSERIGIVLGVVMLFFVILSFVQMLLNPDAITDKEKGAVSIIKKTIIVIVMLGVSNYAFSALYNVQKIVVESNIISKILLPYRIETEINGEQTSNTETVMDNQKFGSLLSEELFMSFYRLEEFQEDAKMSIEDENLYTACQATVNAFRTQIINYNRFDLGYNCLNEDITVSFKVDNSNSSNEQETSIVNFNWPLSVICGIFVVYMIFMYCLKVGVRMVQLMFLEIISPMAFVSYLSPKKDTMFNKWEKMYFATYIDVFIRIAIINFVFFLIATLFSTNGVTGLKFSESMSNVNGYTKSFYTVVIILALLTFAKKAPDLLKSLLPESASKLGFGMSSKDIFGLGALVGGTVGLGIGTIGRVPGALTNTGRAIGMIGNDFKNAKGLGGKTWAVLRGTGHAIGTGISSTAGIAFGGLSGVTRGGYAGLGSKGGMISAAHAGQQAQAKANLARAQRITSGTTITERASDATRGLLGMQSGYARTDSTLSAYNSLNSLINDEDIVKDYQKMYDTAVQKISELESEGKPTDDAYAYAAKAQAQLKTVKSKLFESIVTGNSFDAGSTLEYKDANGNMQSFKIIGEINANDSMKNALSNVANVSGKNYTDIGEFKSDRNKLQAESKRLHKNS